MTARRWLYGLLAPAGLLVLPACGTGPLLPRRDPGYDQLIESVARTTPRKKEKDFGTLPAAPGEVVPLAPQAGTLVAAPISVRKADTEIPAVTEPVNKNERNLVANVIPPPDADPPLVRAFADFHAGHPEAALARLSGFDKPKQEFALQVMPVVAGVFQDDALTDPEKAEVFARTLESAAAALRKRAGLTVTKAVLCEDVQGYGRYLPVRDRNDLRRGEPYLVYVELGNVPCEPFTRSDGVDGFQTRLEVSLQVTDDTGRAIEIIDLKTNTSSPKSVATKTEFFRSPVHDYHIRANVQAPKRSGNYTVTVEVREPKSGRVVSRPVPFRVQ